MIECLIALTALSGLLIFLGGWLSWQLLRQNGRTLLRLDELEERLDALEFEDEPGGSRPEEALTNGADRASRFANRSLAGSKIKRDGLAAGTFAPGFRLPRLDGGDLSLEDFRGRRVLLVFSDPHCGPCNALAPHLERFHREHSEITVLMISRGEPKENRAKVKEHGLSFPVVLQQRWEISRRFAIFATPIAYLIDEAGVTVANVVVGLEPILTLMEAHRARASGAASSLRELPGIG